MKKEKKEEKEKEKEKAEKESGGSRPSALAFPEGYVGLLRLAWSRFGEFLSFSFFLFSFFLFLFASVKYKIPFGSSFLTIDTMNSPCGYATWALIPHSYIMDHSFMDLLGPGPILQSPSRARLPQTYCLSYIHVLQSSSFSKHF